MDELPEAGLEEAWERREPFVSLAPAAIARMLVPVFGPHPLVQVEPISAGRANTNYRVQVAGRDHPVVLRLYTRDPNACRRDQALYQLVSARVPVPDLLYADASCARSEHPYAVFGWVEGVSLATAVRAHPHAAGRAAGATLAAIGTYTFPHAGEFAPDLTVASGGVPFSGYIEHCLDAGAAAVLGEPLAGKVRDFVRRHAAYFPPAPRPAPLVHGDYKDGNLLLRPESDGWAVAAVLDWEFAFAGPPLFDLSILLRHSARLPSVFEQGVAAGYTGAGGTLPPEWKHTARLLDFANLCDFLRQPGHRPALVRESTALIEATLRTWDTLA